MTCPVYNAEILYTTQKVSKQSNSDGAINIGGSCADARSYEYDSDQFTEYTTYTFLRTPITSGLQYADGNIITFPVKMQLNSVQFCLAKVETPTDNVKCELYDADDVLVATATNTVTPTNAVIYPAEAGSFVFYTFTFDSVAIAKDIAYRIRVSRTGTEDLTNYYVCWDDRLQGGYPYNAPRGTRQISSGEFIAYFKIALDQLELMGAGSSFEFEEGEITALQNPFTIAVTVSKILTPTDDLEMVIYDSTGEQVLISTNTINTEGIQIFSFDGSPGLVYLNLKLHWIVRRTGATDLANYWTIATIAANPDPYCVLTREDIGVYDDLNPTFTEIEGQGAWYEMITGDLSWTGIDISDDVRAIRTNTGKNDIDGSLLQGIADITFDNKSKRYSQENNLSDLYGIFRPFNQIRLWMTYDGNDIPLFRGYIKTITPDLKWDTQNITVSVYDRFYLFQEAKTTLGVQGGMTASELIEALLVDMGLTSEEYNIDYDYQELAEFDFTDMNVLNALRLVMQAGQHNHFIDAESVYQFHTNQWPPDNICGFTFRHNDSSVIDAVVNYEHEGIANKVKVRWGLSNPLTDADYVIVEDGQSKIKYGLKEIILDNELMPTSNNIYAGFIAKHILDLLKEPGNALSLTIVGDYDAITILSWGDRLRFIHTGIGLDFVYIIYGISHMITNEGKHEVTYVCRKWQSPLPLQNYFWWIPFGGDEYIPLNADATFMFQGFKRTTDFKIYEAAFKLQYERLNPAIVGSVWLKPLADLQCRIYAADGSGFPTGDPLATSNFIPAPVEADMGIDPINKSFVFSFPEGQQITLTGDTQYCFVINTSKSTRQFETLSGTISTSVGLSNTITRVAQSFILPRNCDLARAYCNMTWHLAGKGNLPIVGYLCSDSDGLPGDIITFAYLPPGHSFYWGDQIGGPAVLDFETLPTQGSIGMTGYPISLSAGNKYWIVWVTDKAGYIGYTPPAGMSAWHIDEVYGKTGDQYSDGESAWYNNGTWELIPDSFDIAIYLLLNNYENKWKFWGRTDDYYADGIAGYLDFWTDPYEMAEDDFYFKLRLLTD